MNTNKRYIDADNLSYFWQKVKSYVDSNISEEQNVILGLQQQIIELRNNIKELNDFVNLQHPVQTQADIMEAIKAGKPFKLVNDVELDTCIALNEGDVCDINLNGHTIKGGLFTESNGSFNEGDTDSFAFWNKGGVLNISGDGVVEAQNAKYSMAVWTQGGTTIINGGTYTNAGEGADLIYASANGAVEIYGGYFEACIKQPGVDGTMNIRSALNVKDVDYRNGTAKITVYGGEFLEFDPSNNLSEGPNTNFVAEGYKSTLEGNVYKVSEYTVGSQDDIIEAIKAGKHFKLANDVELDTCVTLNEGDVCNINLNGHTIKGGLFTESNGSFSEGDTDSYAFWNKGGVLNISGDGVVEAQSAKYSMAVWAQGGTTIINSGTYTNAGEGADLIYASANGAVEIYGGYFEACIKQPGVDGTMNTRSTLNVKDADYRNGTAKITVYGGEFLEFDPSNNLSEGPNTNFVAEGYKSTLEGNVYKVNEYTVGSQDDIIEAIKTGKSFKLANDVELDTCIALNEGDVCNINLNGHTIKGGLFTESNGSFNEGDTDSYAFWNKGGVLNISGDGVVEAQNAKYSMAVWAQGGTTIINGGTYTNAGEGADLIYASANGAVEIYGGYFEACVKQPGVDGTMNTRSTLNVKDADYRNGTAKITVYGGEFLEFDPSNNLSEGPNTNFVAEGYKSTLEGNVYKVGK